MIPRSCLTNINSKGREYPISTCKECNNKCSGYEDWKEEKYQNQKNLRTFKR